MSAVEGETFQRFYEQRQNISQESSGKMISSIYLFQIPIRSSESVISVSAFMLQPFLFCIFIFHRGLVSPVFTASIWVFFPLE